MKKHFIILFLLIGNILNLASKEKILKFEATNNMIYDFCLSPDENFIYNTNENNIDIFSVNTQKKVGELTGNHTQKILCLDLSSDNKTLASGGRDSIIVIWDLATLKAKNTIDYSDGLITDIRFSPDGNYVLYGSSNNHAYLYNLESNKVVKEFNDFDNDVIKVDFVPERDFIVIGSADKKIRIYDSKNYNLLKELNTTTNWTRDFMIYDYGRQMLSVGDDGRILYWNLEDINTAQPQMLKKASKRILSIHAKEQENRYNVIYVIGNMKGKVTFETNWTSDFINLKSPVSKIRFIENKDTGNIKILAGTLGAGLLYFDLSIMNTTSK